MFLRCDPRLRAGHVLGEKPVLFRLAAEQRQAAFLARGDCFQGVTMSGAFPLGVTDERDTGPARGYSDAPIDLRERWES